MQIELDLLITILVGGWGYVMGIRLFTKKWTLVTEVTYATFIVGLAVLITWGRLS